MITTEKLINIAIKLKVRLNTHSWLVLVNNVLFGEYKTYELARIQSVNIQNTIKLKNKYNNII